ncbi:Jerky -like protein-like [Trichinella pseudospiralis]|uniref:Jerky-like protein-like n=1 Tax=Trichinella pseudospiralis TaxID=6337 RepID=A0A0V1IRU3_TRIPS|nr:Jerky -like protein-like [Trichinella pseudospiralis]KRZ40633.1 Jerky -like protein-like [Trichinella pseudospiralis]
MSGKRKRTVIFLKKKIKILMTIKAGDSYKKISIKFGINVQTISDIKRNGKRIADFMTKFQAEGDGDSRKTMKQACNVKLDTALYIWFVQRRSLNQIVSGEILRTKAMYLGAKLGVDKFSASGERLSADQSSAEDFTKNLSQYLKNNEYKPDFVCNADETGKTGKVFLLIDNAPCHPNAQDLERKDGKFKAIDELNSESDSEENSVMRKEVLDNFNINIGQIEELLADDDCNTFKVLTDKEIIEVVQESTADEPEEAMDS